jgi:hypothetical protein
VVHQAPMVNQAPVIHQAPAPDPFTYTPREMPASAHVVPPRPRRRDDEEKSRPRQRKPTDGDKDRDDDLRELRALKQEDTMLSVISMILGIVSAVFGVFSMCCCGGAMTSPIAGIGGAAAIVLGVMGQKRGGRNYAITGISLGIVGVLFALAALALLVLGLGLNFFGPGGFVKPGGPAVIKKF